jgi:hypothetical protein
MDEKLRLLPIQISLLEDILAQDVEEAARHSKRTKWDVGKDIGGALLGAVAGAMTTNPTLQQWIGLGAAKTAETLLL